jgi:hypothetical protein
MFRHLALAACLVAAPVYPVMAESPAKKETPEQRANRCSMQAGIVRVAIEQRNANRGQNRAAKVIARSPGIEGTKYESNIDILVSWVYRLPRKQLNGDTVETFHKACVEYNG